MFEAEAFDENLEQLRGGEFSCLEACCLLLEVVEVLWMQLLSTQINELVELLLLHVSELFELDVFDVHFRPALPLRAFALLALEALVFRSLVSTLC